MRRSLLLLALTAALAACTASPDPPQPPAAAPPPAPATSTIDPATILAVPRPAGTVRTAGAITVPLAGGLEIVCLVGRPPDAVALTAGDLPGLGLTRSQALALATANAAAGLRPFAELTRNPLPAGGVGTIAGDFAESSLLLLHDQWAPVAAAMHGALLVAAPADDLVLYADGSVPGAAGTLRMMAASAMRAALRPVSSVVLRWTRSGWEAAGPQA